MHDLTPIERVSKWLSEQGRQLEYEVEHTLRGLGFKTTRGRYYLDPNEGKAREIDVVAAVEVDPHQREPYAVPSVQLAVECKMGGAPWAVMTSDGPVPEWMSIATESFLGLAGADVHKHLKVPRPVALDVVAADPKNRDLAYQAMMQAINAATAIVAGQWAPPLLVVPVIVTSSALVSVGFREDGTEEVQEVPWTRVVWHGSGVTKLPTIVDVVSREAFAARAGQIWLEILEPP